MQAEFSWKFEKYQKVNQRTSNTKNYLFPDSQYVLSPISSPKRKNNHLKDVLVSADTERFKSSWLKSNCACMKVRPRKQDKLDIKV